MGEGRRATSEELASWEWTLGGWLRPEAFDALVTSIAEQLDDHALDQAGSVYTDAWTANRCATLTRASGVRLGANPPDFELRFGRRVERCEAVEVLAPGRRRGAELKVERSLPSEERSKPKQVPAEEWVSADDALAQVEASITAKAGKGYSPDTVLVIYLNVGFVKGSQRLSDGIARAVQPAFPTFKEAWVLEGGDIRVFRPT